MILVSHAGDGQHKGLLRAGVFMELAVTEGKDMEFPLDAKRK